MPAYAIRPVERGDAAQIAQIYRPIVEATTISFEEVAPATIEMKRRIVSHAETYPWLVAATGEGEIAGYAHASQHRARHGYRFSTEVSVYVKETWRRCGVGRTLYAELFAELVRRGFHRAFAGITVPNPASIALHHSLGFEPVGVFREVGRKFDRWLDVAWWQRGL